MLALANLATLLCVLCMYMYVYVRNLR